MSDKHMKQFQIKQTHIYIFFIVNYLLLYFSPLFYGVAE